MIEWKHLCHIKHYIEWTWLWKGIKKVNCEIFQRQNEWSSSIYRIKDSSNFNLLSIWRKKKNCWIKNLLNNSLEWNAHQASKLMNKEIKWSERALSNEYETKTKHKRVCFCFKRNVCFRFYLKGKENTQWEKKCFFCFFFRSFFSYFIISFNCFDSFGIIKISTAREYEEEEEE